MWVNDEIFIFRQTVTLNLLFSFNNTHTNNQEALVGERQKYSLWDADECMFKNKVRLWSSEPDETKTSKRYSTMTLNTNDARSNIRKTSERKALTQCVNYSHRVWHEHFMIIELTHLHKLLAVIIVCMYIWVYSEWV